MPTNFSTDALLAACDTAFNPAGSWGYFTLLKPDLATLLGYAANPTTDLLTTVSPHGLVTGSKIWTSGTLPTPLLANTDYFAIVVSPTTLKLATGLIDAQAATAIDLTDAGSGTLTLTEQALSAADPLSVLINKEIIHPSWPSRKLITDLGAAAISSGIAQKPVQTITIANSAATPLVFQDYLFILSNAPTAGTLGNIPVGAGFILGTDNQTTIAIGDPPTAIFLQLQVRNP